MTGGLSQSTICTRQKIASLTGWRLVVGWLVTGGWLIGGWLVGWSTGGWLTGRLVVGGLRFSWVPYFWTRKFLQTNHSSNHRDILLAFEEMGCLSSQMLVSVRDLSTLLSWWLLDLTELVIKEDWEFPG